LPDLVPCDIYSLSFKILERQKFDDVEIPNVRFEALKAVNMVITIFWDVGPCRLIALHHTASTDISKDSSLHFCNKGALMMGGASSTHRNNGTSMCVLKQAALNGIKPPRFSVDAY
jgi:hypothetical protein